MFPPTAITALSDFFYETDQKVRSDLSNSRVVGERDYLSRFITLLEYTHQLKGSGTFPFRSTYISNSFPGPLEQRYGCDAFFIFRYAQKIKILAIEGKYPRFQNAQ